VRTAFKSFIRYEHVFILHISAIPRAFVIRLWVANGPFRWNIAIVVDVPDSYIGFIRRKFGVGPVPRTLTMISPFGG